MKLRRPDLGPGQVYEQAKDVLAQLNRPQGLSGAIHPLVAGLYMDEDQAIGLHIDDDDASREGLSLGGAYSKSDGPRVSQEIRENDIVPALAQTGLQTG